MKLTKILVALAAFAFAPVAAHAQTTGVPGFNDYIVNGTLSGSTSALTVNVPGGGPTIFELSSTPFTPVAFFFSLCPASPCWFPLSPVGCPIPFTACSGTTNNSIDIDFSCPTLVMSMTTDAFGFASSVINLPPGMVFSTQAGVLHPCAAPPIRVMMSQAYTVTT